LNANLSIPSVAGNGLLRPPSATSPNGFTEDTPVTSVDMSLPGRRLDALSVGANSAISYKAALQTVPPVRSQTSTPAIDAAGNVSNATKDKLTGRRAIGLRCVNPHIVECN
jgi:hypothetical protein